ncbi:MAG: hypothetical protein C5B46_05885 [Proteobacteria bacterium]|nr:MAG: hypothetical protein C5B46_05885 [Pseudomonadota bacterium]
MAFPIRTCVICGEEFELRPDKPGFANRCPDCSTPEAEEERANRSGTNVKGDSEQNAARRKAIRDLLYRKES